MQSITITKPDDWHVHFRDGDKLKDTVSATAIHFARALVMPNLQPPLTTLASILSYRDRIIAAAGSLSFTPYMTFFLNEAVNKDDLKEAAKQSFILGGKLYPSGATTNSEAGTRAIKNLYPLFEIMETLDLVLQIHGETTHGDIFSRETLFLSEFLSPILENFPKLRVVLEHISSQDAVSFVLNGPSTLAATITPHHLFFNRNHMLVGGIKPHYYCLPILKAEEDQRALQYAATLGNPKFFAGTDSAPHARGQKESACGCAGIYSAPCAVEMYTQVFNDRNKLEQLDAFMGIFGAQFYHLPINSEKITIIHKKKQIPEKLVLGNEEIVPVAAGSYLEWQVCDE